MNTIDKAHRAILSQVARSDERSSLFWYMFDHHDEIVATAAGNRMRWRRLCAQFEAAGLTDTSGKPATPRNARETWRQVRLLVQRARREKLTGIPARKKQPRDLPHNTMPIVAEPARRSMPPQTASNWGAGPPGETSIDRLRRVMQGR